jgi:deoxyribose-phosphate aldolase
MDRLAEIIELARDYEQQLPPPPPPLKAPVGPEIAGWIDHTLLKPEATAAQVKTLCQEAAQYHFASVCVNPVYVPLAAGLLSGSDVPVCSVIGFPLGASLPSHKAMEALACLEDGARELDMVLHIGALKGQAYGQVFNEIMGVVLMAHNQQALVKVILETCLLTRFEKIVACLICKAAGADFVKTSTGFSSGGATVEDIDLMYRVVGDTLKVKASGGVRDLAGAQAMIAAGASRIGASSGVQIVSGAAATAGDSQY